MPAHPDLEDVAPQQAVALLAEVERMRVRARRELRHDTWQWLVPWSVIFAGSALISMGGHQPAARLYWLVAIPAGIVAGVLIDTWLQPGLRPRRRDWPYWAVGGSITAASLSASAILPTRPAVAVAWASVGAGFAALTWLDRIPRGRAMFAGAVAASIGFAVLVPDPAHVSAMNGLIYAVAAGGIAWWGRSQSSSGRLR